MTARETDYVKNSVFNPHEQQYMAFWNPKHFAQWYGDIDEGGLDYFVCFYKLLEPLRGEDDYGYDVNVGEYVAVSLVTNLSQLSDEDFEAHMKAWGGWIVSRVDPNSAVNVPAWAENGKFVCSFGGKRVILADADEFQCKRYYNGWWESAVGFNPNRFLVR